MNFHTTNLRVVSLAASALAGMGVVAALSQRASAQTGSTMSHRMQKTVSAMTDPARHARMQREWQKMIVMYHITHDQQIKIEKMGTELDHKWVAIFSNKLLTDDQKKSQMVSLAAKSVDQMNAVLTREQRAMIEARQERMMQARTGQMKSGGAAKPTH